MLAVIELLSKIMNLWLGNKIKDKAELAKRLAEKDANMKSLAAFVSDINAYGKKYMDAKAKLDAKFDATKQGENK